MSMNGKMAQGDAKDVDWPTISTVKLLGYTQQQYNLYPKWQYLDVKVSRQTKAIWLIIFIATFVDPFHYWEASKYYAEMRPIKLKYLGKIEHYLSKWRGSVSPLNHAFIEFIQCGEHLRLMFTNMEIKRYFELHVCHWQANVNCLVKWAIVLIVNVIRSSSEFICIKLSLFNWLQVHGWISFNHLVFNTNKVSSFWKRPMLFE